MLTNRRTLAVTLRNKMYVPQTECPRTTRQSWSIQKKVNNVRTNKYNKRIKFLRPPYPPPYPPLTSLKPTFPTFPNTYLSHFNFIKNWIKLGQVRNDRKNLPASSDEIPNIPNVFAFFSAKRSSTSQLNVFRFTRCNLNYFDTKNALTQTMPVRNKRPIKNTNRACFSA